MSAIERTTDSSRTSRHVGFVPDSDRGVLSDREACHQLEMSSGWAVNVKKGTSDDLESSKTFYTRVSGRQDAERAVRDHLTSPSHVIEARLPVQSSVFDALGIPAGGILLKVQ